MTIDVDGRKNNELRSVYNTSSTGSRSRWSVSKASSDK